MKKGKYGSLSYLKDTRVLTGCAFLIALSAIIDFFRLAISQTAEISFGFVPIAFAGIVFGPIVGGIVGGMADILQYIVRPTGPFFPGFTLNSILVGVFFGLFLYRREMTLKRLILCMLVGGIIINLCLTPIWLKMMYGTTLFAIPRVIRFIILLPIKVAVIYVIWRLIASKSINILKF